MLFIKIKNPRKWLQHSPEFLKSNKIQLSPATKKLNRFIRQMYFSFFYFLKFLRALLLVAPVARIRHGMILRETRLLPTKSHTIHLGVPFSQTRHACRPSVLPCLLPAFSFLGSLTCLLLVPHEKFLGL